MVVLLARLFAPAIRSGPNSAALAAPDEIATTPTIDNAKAHLRRADIITSSK